VKEGVLCAAQRSALRLATTAALLGVLVVGAPSASAANLSMNVTFFANGTITVTLPDGTPVGVTSGAPTVIPAGFYTMNMIGPGGCSTLPYFNLRGPGNNILDNMDQGEESGKSVNATFLPNSTYTWVDLQSPSVVYTFATNDQVLGTAPSPPVAANHGTSAGQELVLGGTGASAPFQGTLVGAISPAGRLTLSFNRHSVTSLGSGRYTLKVDDRSASGGFFVQKLGHRAVSYSGIAFVGEQTASLHLTAGTWAFMARLGHPAYTITVH
jgi:hypothetical protein